MIRVNGWGRKQAMRNFFLSNPSEELTYSDLVVKFDCPTNDIARQYVKELKREGLIESVHVIRLAAKGRA